MRDATRSKTQTWLLETPSDRFASEETGNFRKYETLMRQDFGCHGNAVSTEIARVKPEKENYDDIFKLVELPIVSSTS